MGTKRIPRKSRASVSAEGKQKARRAVAWLIPFSFGVIATGICFVAASASKTSTPPARIARTAEATTSSDFPRLDQLLAMSDEQLAEYDVAVLNLRAAEGLPGAEKLDIAECCRTLDKWAAWVKHETERHLYKYRQNPKNFNNSEGYYRMMMLITVLQQDFNVHYNPDRIRDIDFRRSKDLFIHGMIASDNGGTCVSMPPLYTAVARRLGYPIYLVTAKEHVFCRWEKGNERFNIEATNQGMNSFDDAYYMKWPKPISGAEIEAGEYLKSLSGAESLAMFLAARGHCLEDSGHAALATVSYAQAAALSPRSIYQGFLVQSVGLGRLAALQRAIAQRPPIEPPMVYRRYIGHPDFYTPPHAGSYSPYRASKPIMPNMVGFPQTNGSGVPNTLPEIGLPP